MNTTANNNTGVVDNDDVATSGNKSLSEQVVTTTPIRNKDPLKKNRAG
jgi:hypothetical protein